MIIISINSNAVSQFHKKPPNIIRDNSIYCDLWSSGYNQKPSNIQ